MDNCPRCRQPLKRTRNILRDYVVLGCVPCRKVAVEVPGIKVEWIDGGPGWRERLEAAADEARRTAEMLSSDADDPRWAEMMG